MKLLVISAFILFSLIEFNAAIRMNAVCDHGIVTRDYRPPRNLLLCISYEFTDKANPTMTDVYPLTTIAGFRLADTEALLLGGDEEIIYFPSNLDTFFPNLKVLLIAETRLSQVSSANLRPFPKLEILVFGSNRITELPANLLESSPELLEFAVIGPPNFNNETSLHTIGSGMLTKAPKLEYVVLWNHTCIHEVALTRAAVVELSEKVRLSCNSAMSMIGNVNLIAIVAIALAALKMNHS